MTCPIKRYSTYALFYFPLLLVSMAKESHQTDLSGALNVILNANGTAPGPCTNVKFNQTALNVTVSWTAPVVKNSSLGGYIIEYRLRDKIWSPKVTDALANYTVAYTFMKSKTTTAFEFFLTAFNAFNSTHSIVGPTTRIYNDASHLLASSVLPIILALYSVVRG